MYCKKIDRLEEFLGKQTKKKKKHVKIKSSESFELRVKKYLFQVK